MLCPGARRKLPAASPDPLLTSETLILKPAKPFTSKLLVFLVKEVKHRQNAMEQTELPFPPADGPNPATRTTTTGTSGASRVARGGEGGGCNQNISFQSYVSAVEGSFPLIKSKAAPQLRRLVAGFPPRRPGFKPESGHVGFCDGHKWRWGRFSPRTSRFPLPMYIPSASPQSSSLSPEAGTIGQEWPQCQ
jgi:hypothetical protein